MFYKNEILAEFPALTRLLFTGLWGLADRCGRMEYRPKFIKVEILPYDNCDIEKMLADLAKKDFVRIYERRGKKIIWIVNFEKHQRISGKEAESDSELPAYREADVKQSGSNGEALGSAGREGKGREGKGKEDNTVKAEALLLLWNELRGNLPEAQKLTRTRKDKCALRLKERSLEEWKQVISKIAASSFCQGGGATGWKASFDWLIASEDNHVKVMEGKYDDRTTGNGAAYIPGKYARIAERKGRQEPEGLENIPKENPTL